MGAKLVGKVCKAWGKRLSNNGFRALTRMALTALDEGNERMPACIYRDGHEALAEALQDSDTKSEAALQKAVQRAVEELLAVGAVALEKKARSQGKSEYRLTLDREPRPFQRDRSGLDKLREVQQDTVCPPELTSQEDTPCPPGFVPQQDTTCPPAPEIQVDTTCLAQVDTTCPIQVDTSCPPLEEEPEGTIEEPFLFASLTAEPETTKQAAPKTRKGRGKKPTTLISDDFEITPKMRSWAGKHCPDVNIDLHTIRFVNHAHEKDRLLADWERGWQNWMAIEQDRFSGHRPRMALGAEPVSSRYAPLPTLTRPDWDDE